MRKFNGFTELLDIEDQRKVLHTEKNLELITSKVNLSRRDMPYSPWEGTPEHKIPLEIRNAKIAQEKALAIELQSLICSLLDQQRKVRDTTSPPETANHGRITANW